MLEFNPAEILLEFDNTPLATEKFLAALSETDSLNLSPTAGVPEIVTANPLARLKVEPDVKVNVPELAPVVKFCNETLAGRRLEQITGAFVSFWFAWAAFFPETVVWDGSGS